MRTTNTYFAIILLLILSCKSQKKMEGEIQEKEKSPKNSITFTKEQIEIAEIKTGLLEKRLLSDYVECSGNISVPPQGIATISAPIGGFVKKLYHIPGEYVQSGSVLAVLQHPDYIKLQQDYLEAKNQQEYFQEEFRRQGELTLDHAASLKKMQQSQADFKVNEAKMKALKAQLEFIGINPEQVEKSGFTPDIEIYAPICGYISILDATIGKYIDPFSPIYEIIDKRHLHLHLKVFEKDIFKIKKGQRIDFYTINTKNSSYKSNVTLIGQKIDAKDNAVDVLGEIDDATPFIPGMYVTAKVYLQDSAVYSLPVTSIVQEGEGRFIFIKTNDLFLRAKITTGVEQNDFVEIKNPDDFILKQIVITGAYYLNGELNKESE